MGVATKIGEAAKEKGISLKELSRQVDIPYTTLYHAVKRDSKMEFETVKKVADALNISWYTLLGADDELQGLVKAVDNIDYNPQINRPMVDADGRLYMQDLKTLEDLQGKQVKDNHSQYANYSHKQLFGVVNGLKYIDELYYCLNEKGQKMLGEIAKGICMLDEYRVDGISLASFLTYDKLLRKEQSPAAAQTAPDDAASKDPDKK